MVITNLDLVKLEHCWWNKKKYKEIHQILWDPKGLLHTCLSLTAASMAVCAIDTAASSLCVSLGIIMIIKICPLISTTLEKIIFVGVRSHNIILVSQMRKWEMR